MMEQSVESDVGEAKEITVFFQAGFFRVDGRSRGARAFQDHEEGLARGRRHGRSGF
tara:strand:- start:2119 stop:2286 length:168 start_codon:yes stop_codon:yes gene_type:complete